MLFVILVSDLPFGEENKTELYGPFESDHEAKRWIDLVDPQGEYNWLITAATPPKFPDCVGNSL